MLKEFERWLRRGINESAADSLLEAFEDILTLPTQAQGACAFKKIAHLHQPNREYVLGRLRECEGNIKRYRSSTMSQRWQVFSAPPLREGI